MDVKTRALKVVIFDLDGTLALNDHRQHFVEGPAKDWDGFFQACDQDSLNHPVAMIYGMISCFMQVQIWSGRSESVRDKTMLWLQSKCLAVHHLKMRPIGDFSPDEVLKKKWLDEIGSERILMVFDDRQKVVDMWRENGVTCAQVAKGNF